MQKKHENLSKFALFLHFFIKNPAFSLKMHIHTYKHKKITHSQSYLQVGDRLFSLLGCRFQVFGVMRLEKAKNQLQHH